MNRDRLTADFDNNIAPAMVGVEKEPTFVAAELQDDLDVLAASFRKVCGDDVTPDCLGVWGYRDNERIQGCIGHAQRFHFLVPWIEMKKRGIPKFLRTHPTVVAPMCENCYLLYDSKHRRLRTAWGKKAGLTMRKSPQFMRTRYQPNYDLLIDTLRTEIQAATSFIDTQYLKHAIVRTLTVNSPDKSGVTTNIDTTQLKQYGVITYTRWTLQSFNDRETPM